MKKVLVLTSFLLVGLGASQILPELISHYEPFEHWIKIFTMVMLAYIMIYIGYEFEIDKSNVRQYAKDYFVAFLAAFLPWVFVAFYFVFVLDPLNTDCWECWTLSLLAARFASPTSAGILFTMLTAANLSHTWVFKKVRVLAIFDDLDTVLIMIPLQMLIIGFRIELVFVVIVITFLLTITWKFFHKIKLSMKWQYILLYAVSITAVCETLYYFTKSFKDGVPIQVEVLLPAFVLGTIISKKYNQQKKKDEEEKVDVLELPSEQKAYYMVSLAFMVLVGLSLPHIGKMLASVENGISVQMIALHVFAITIISNVGKLVPLFFYKDESTFKERLATSVAMFPRGEVGAGVLVISISYGVGGIPITVAMLSLALNLILSAVFIYIVKKLIEVSSYLHIKSSSAIFSCLTIRLMSLSKIVFLF
jgi:hypothetical protein